MRQLYHLFFLSVLSVLLLRDGLKAQTSAFPVDLSSSTDTTWSITGISRNGNFCNSSGCIKFDVTVNPLSTQLGFDVKTPAPTGASAFYQVNCGPATSLGTKLCISGMTTFSITFCKTGNDQPVYYISAGRGYSGSADISLRANGSCSGNIGVQGMQKSSVTWTSIFPGSQGAYNSYLSCTTGCDTISVTAPSGAPAYIDYKVTGTINGCSTGAISDTIRVYTYPTLNANITPANPVICSGGPTSVTLIATPTGGNPPYTYSWTGPNGFISTAQSPTVNTGGVYTVSVSDNTGCSPVTKTVSVVASPTPTVTSATTGSVCSGFGQNYTITSGVTGATYTWSRAAVAGISNGAVTGQTASTITEALINTTASPVNVTYIITPAANGCTGSPFNYVVTVNPTATVTAVPNQVVCNNSAVAAVNFGSPATGGTVVYNWTNNTPSIGLAASGTGNIASFTALNTGTAPVTATITVTPSYTSGGTTCSGTATTFTITVNPTATVTAVPNQVVCNGAATTAVNFGSPATGGTVVYNWTNNTPSIGLAATGTGNIASFTALNTGTAPVTATITVTPSYTSGGTTCSGTATTFTITVNPTATVTAVPNQVVCNNSPVAAVNFASPTTGGTIVYNWTNNTPSIGLAASGTGNIASFTALNTGTAPVTATITVTPSYTSGGTTCSGTATTFTITVNPTATVTAVPNQVVCNNSPVAAVNFGSPATGGTVVYNWTNNTPSIGLAASGTGNIASFTALNTGTAPVTATITVMPIYTSGGTTCPGTATTFTITVNPTATVTAVPNQVVCNNSATTAVNFGSPATGGTIVYNWTNNTPSIGLAASGTGNIASFSALNTGTAPVTATITVTPSYTSGGTTCPGTATTFTITVNPTATVTAVPNQVVCNNSPVAAVNFASPTTGGTIVYNWTNNTPSIGLAASGTGNIASFTALNTGTAPVTATITVTPSYTSGGTTCPGTATTFTITVNPTATVTAVPNQVVCNNSATTAVNFGSPATGGTVVYNWTNNTPSIGLAASGTGNIASFTALNTGTAPVTATITVTPSYTSGGTTCPGTATTFTITVNPTATVTAVPNQVVCNNSATTAVNFGSPATGGTVVYNWTNNTPSIGLAASGTGNIASFTALNTGTAPVTATITVTPSYTSGGTTCSGTATTFTITVNPTATVTAVPNQVVCNNSATTAVNFGSPATGGTVVYNWTNNTPSIGLAATGTGNIASFTALNTGTAPVTATITVTPSYTSGGTTCPGTATTFTITVNTTATVTAVPNQVVCNNSATTAVNFGSPATGGTVVYNWTNNTPSIGLAASGTGNIASFSALNTGTAPVTATITVTPSYTSGGTTCSGTATTFTITVNPTATVTAVPNQVVCNNSATTAVNFGSPATGGTVVYNWTNNTPSMGLAASGTGNIASFTALNTGTAPVTATITVTPSYTSGGTTCPGTATTFTITVNPTATVTAVPNQVVCNNSPVAAVNFASPTTGGTIVYNWTNNTPSIGLAASGTGNIASFTALNTGTAPVTATITVTPSYTSGGTTCSGTATTFTITVNPTATVTAVPNQVVCNNSPVAAVNFASPTTGGTIVYNWTNNTPSIGLAASGTGNIASFTALNTGTAPVTATITVTPSYTSGGTTCSGTATTFTITVNPTATVTAVPNQVVCNGAATTAVNFGSPATGGTVVYNWTNNTPSIGLAATGTGNIASFTALNTGTAPVTATITVTPSYTSGGTTCPGTATTFTITVNPTATVTAVPNQVVCNNSPVAAVNFASPTTGGTIVYNWTNNTPSIGLAASGTGNIASFTALNTGTAPVTATITVTPSYTSGGTTCSGTATTFTITVNPTATVTAVPNQVVCNNSATTAVNFGSPATGGTVVYNWTNNTPSIGLAASGTGNIASFTALNTGTAPVTATITVTPSYTSGGTTCPGTATTFTITVNPTATVTAVPNQVVCNNSPVAAVNFASPTTGGTIVYNWTNNTPSIGLAATGTGNIASFTALNTGTAPVTATITVTPSYTSGGTTCPGTATTFTITVNPTATVTAVPNQVVCNNSATTAVNFGSPATGGTVVYNWTNNTPSIGLAASGTGNIASFTALNTGTAPVTATITVTPSYTSGGTTCPGTPTTFTITVNPTATVTAVPNQVVCNNSATTAVNFGSPATGGTVVYNWTNNTPSIGLAASGTGNIASFSALNTGTAPVTATITVTPSYTSGGTTCPGTPTTFTITVNPTATVTAVPNQVVCNNSATTAVNFGSPATGGTVVYNWTNNTPSIGLAATGTGNIASFTALNTGTAPVTATITVTPSYTSGGTTCSGTATTFTITVNPTATVTAVPNQVVCNNSPVAAVNFASPTTGGTIVYNWTNNTPSIGLAASGTGNIASFTALNTGTAPVTATITVTPSYTSGGTTCPGTATTFTITVNPTATVTAVPNQVVCNNSPVAAVNFASPTTGGTIVYNWTNNTPSIGLAATGTGNIASFTALNTGTAPVTATITVTPSYTSGGTTCSGTATTFTITVNPTATVTAVPNQVVCNNSPVAAVNFASPTTGGTIVYNWTNNTPSIGLAASGTGNIASFTALNTGTAPVTATITVTPSYTSGGTTCSGTATTFTITVNPTATVTAVPNQVVCNNSATTAVNFGSPATGGTVVYNWTNNTPSIGLAASGTGNIASFTALNTGTAPVTATITVTPSYTSGGTTCPGTATTFTITVNPTATVTAVPNQVVCNNSATTAVNFGSPATGGTVVYNWTNNTPSIGLAATGTGNIASFTALNTGTAPVTATITVTPSYTSGGTTCSGTATTFTITVNPTATVTAVPNQVVCNNSATTAVNFGSPATGGTVVYNWTNNTPSIGLAATGTGNIASFTALNTGTAPVTATITVTPSYTSGGTTCPGTATTFTITVNPTATVTAVPNQVVCNNSATTAVNFGSPATGGTVVYNWTNNTPSIGLAASGTGNIASFTALNTGTAPVTATITVTPSYTSGGTTCPGTPTTFTITVNPTATVTAVPNQVVCNNSATTAVNFGSPATGGTVVYNWTNNTPSIGLAASGTGNIASFTALNTGTAPVTATITVTPSYTSGGTTCSGTATTFTITVNPTATVTAVPNQVVCNNSATTAVNFGSPATGGTVVYNWTNNTPSMGLAASGTGNIASFTALNTGTAPVTATITVTPSYTSGGTTCPGTATTFTITVNPTATVTAVPNQVVCNNSATTAVNFGSPATGGTVVYNWTNNTPSIGLAATGTGNIASFTALNTGTAPVTATITVTPSYTSGGTTCSGTATTFTITVNPTATVTAVPNQVVCNNSPVAAVNFASPTTGGTIVYNWTNNTPSIGLAASGTGNIASFTALNTGTAPVTATITVTPSYTSGGTTCPGTATTFTITVNPTATVTAVPNQVVCNNSPVAAVNFGSPATGGTVVYNWTNNTPSIGLAASGTGNIASFTALNTGTAPVTATITVMPIYTSGGTTCSGTPTTFTITVNPTPAVKSAAFATSCNNTNQNYLITSTVAGTTFTWNRASVTGIANTAATGQTVNPIAEALLNTTNSPVSVNYIIKPSANGCTGTSFTYTVMVNPTPIVTSLATATICSDAAQNYTITSNVSGTTFTWSRVSVDGIRNAAVLDQTANPITETLTNISNAPVTVTYVIIPKFNGCAGTTYTYKVTIKPKPETPLIATNSPVCTGNTLNLATPAVADVTYKWAGPNGFGSTLQNPSIANTTLANSGLYSVIVTAANGCSSNVGTGTVVINSTPSTPKASSNGPVCEGGVLNLTASAITGVTYNWTGPNSFISSIQNPTIRNALYANAGTYYVSASAKGCTGLADSTTVAVNENPITPVLTSNSPVCSGGDILLTAPPTRGASYSWTGPNGFISAEQNPTIQNALTDNSGVYDLSVSSPGCPNTGSGFISVKVFQTPNAPTVSNNGPVCAGSSLHLYATAIAGAIYNWTGPNGFTSTSQNPVINNITEEATGLYSVIAIVNGCTSTVATTPVTVKSVPAVPTAGNNTPICDEQTLTLTASAIAGATYTWTGPNNFISSKQNPAIAKATFINEGKYYVSATINGCTSLPDSTDVIINANPIPPGLISNSPVCTGDSLQLTAASVRGADYKWTGPNGFTSTSENPIIPDAVMSNGGTYNVSISAAGCPSKTSSSITVVVNQTPNAPTATNNSPICEGTILNLAASTIQGATYNWVGPNGFSSTSQNPAISSLPANSGSYSVTATVKGCTSEKGNTMAFVQEKPVASAGSDQIVCENNAMVKIKGSVTGSNTGLWSTSGAGTFSPSDTSLIATYTPGAADKAEGSVKLTLTSTNNGVCPASASSSIVTITNAPTANAGADQKLCSNNANVILNGVVTTATGGIWSTSGTGTFNPSRAYLNTTYIPSTKDIINGEVTLKLTTTGNGGCREVADETRIIITAAPVVEAGPEQYILQSQTALLQPTVSGIDLKYLWTPNKYLNNNTSKNPLITGVEDIAYTLKVTDINGCVNEDQVLIKVLKPFKIPNTFTPNNDGINDKWEIPLLNTYPGTHVQVFNRYGQLVFESSGYATPWDGTMNGKPLPFGTYYYVIEAGNWRKPYTGYVTLVK